MYNPYDKMFRYEDYVKSYMDGKYRKSVKGKTGKMNAYFSMECARVRRELRVMNAQLSVCRRILKSFSEENGTDTRYRQKLIWDMVISFSRMRKFYGALGVALSQWSIPDKRLVSALKHDFKTTDDRIARIRRIFLPEYFTLCGIKEYAKALEKENTTIEEDITAWFMDHPRNTEDGETEDSASYYEEVSESYRLHIIAEMEERGILPEDPSALIREENRINEERVNAHKAEKKQKRLAENMLIARRKANDLKSAIEEAFKTGLRTERRGFLIAQKTVDELTNMATENKEYAFSVIIVMKPGKIRGSGNASFIRRGSGGTELTQTLGVAELFTERNKEKAQELIGAAKKNDPDCEAELFTVRIPKNKIAWNSASDQNQKRKYAIKKRQFPSEEKKADDDFCALEDNFYLIMEKDNNNLRKWNYRNTVGTGRQKRLLVRTMKRHDLEKNEAWIIVLQKLTIKGSRTLPIKYAVVLTPTGPYRWDKMAPSSGDAFPFSHEELEKLEPVLDAYADGQIKETKDDTYERLSWRAFIITKKNNLIYERLTDQKKDA